MFDVGFWEVFLIGILALLIVGPERLPRLARSAGLWVGKARRYIEGARDEFRQEVGQHFDVDELKRLLHNQEVQINELQERLGKAPDEFKDDILEGTTPSDITDEEEKK